MSLLSRLIRTFHPGQLERDLDGEQQFHIEQRIADLVRDGFTPAEAARLARSQFGNRLHIREESRDARLVGWFESILHDLRFGLRMLRKDHTIALAAIVSLTLAIGTCTAAFTLIDALMFRPLPVRDPSTLVHLTTPRFDGRPGADDSFSYPLLEQGRIAARGQVELFGLTFGGGLNSAVFDTSGDEEKVRAQWISGAAFDTLGIPPALGRVLAPRDDEPSAGSAAVLSYNFWMRRFGGNPAVLGRWFALDRKQYQVVGVGPKNLTGFDPGLSVDMWLPLPAAVDARALADPAGTWLKIWGRLAPGVTPQRCAQLLLPAFREFRAALVQRIPPTFLPRDHVAAYVASPLALESASTGNAGFIRQEFERSLWILAIFAGLLLMTCCSNVANLLVARAAARERELAMRMAMGAGRWRLIRQLLIESSLLAAAACLLGLAFARYAAPVIVNRLSPSNYPAYLDLRLDWRTILFVASIGVGTVILFGIAPALRASGVSPHDAIRAGGRQSARLGVLQPLFAAQVGFSFMVLFVAGLLLLSFQKLTSVDLGFSSSGVAIYHLKSKVRRDAAQERLAQMQLLDSLRRAPGVQAAGLTQTALMAGDFGFVMTPPVRFPGRGPERPWPRFVGISPGFLETMRVRLIEGRDFDARDAGESPSVLVNQAFVRRYFPGESPLGKQFERATDEEHWQPQQIVGVIANIKYNNVREDVSPTIYFPMRRVSGMSLAVRTPGDPAPMIPSLRREIHRIDPDLNVDSAILQTTQIDNTLLHERLIAMLAAFFGVVALVLAGVGLYGVLTYSVARRTKEIGIRLALGARPSATVRLILRQAGAMAAVGLAIGAAVGIAVSRFVTAFLFEVKPGDLATWALPVVLMLLACGVAAVPPAIRAARLDPVVALREE
jgi:predicted permease